jgi:hypothetical protein
MIALVCHRLLSLRADICSHQDEAIVIETECERRSEWLVTCAGYQAAPAARSPKPANRSRGILLSSDFDGDVQTIREGIACIFARLSDERTYKIVDYLYLGLGLFGLATVLDVQSEIAKQQLSRAGDRYAFYRASRCEHPTSQRCANYTKQQEMMDRAGSDPNALQDMFWLYIDQNMPLIGQQLAGDAGSPQSKILKEDLERFHFEAQELRRSQQSVQNKSRQERFLPIYLLAVALAFRITKVSGELFKLHRSKQEPEPPAGLLQS